MALENTTDVLIFGPQASGKGTQAQVIEARYGLKHISTGDLFRAEIADQTELGVAIKDSMDRGELLSTDIVIRVLEPHLKQATGGIIFDGFPRALAQVDPFLDWLRGMNRKCMMIVLNVPPEVSLARMTSRLTCTDCHQVYRKGPDVQCCTTEGCKGTLEVRADDLDSQAVQRRLSRYATETTPAIDALRSKPEITVVDVNGEQTPEAVSAEIFARLDQVLTQTSAES